MINLIKNKILAKEDIRNYYLNSCKDEQDFKIGLEYERISANSLNKKSANIKSISKIIETFSYIENWGILYDESTIIGAKCGNSTISLEPGGQFEISLEPEKNLNALQEKLNKIIETLNKIAKKHNIEFLETGLTPCSTFNNIEILSKERYLIMEEYFRKTGTFAPSMMKETAGIQVNVDYKSEYDAILKLNLLNKLMPFITGFFANSNIRYGKNINYKSFRALAWKYTDAERTGVFYLKNSRIESFDDYINQILKVPMLFIERNDKKIPIMGKITFEEYMENGYRGYFPTLNDYKLHSSLTFPDIRLKNCIEIRNHDSNTLETAISICALYKGLLKNIEEIKKLNTQLQNLNYEKIEKAGFLAAKYGTDFEISGIKAIDIIKKIYEISYNNLELDERCFLDIIKEKINKI